MSFLDGCPFCGHSSAIIDTLNYTSGNPGRFRGMCPQCNASSEWCETEGEAVAAWNNRVRMDGAAANRKQNVFINKDLFVYKGAFYARNPQTGFCFCDSGARRFRRIKRAVYLLAYADCEKIMGALK
jgi:Lar family restriction alleviation protein